MQRKDGTIVIVKNIEEGQICPSCNTVNNFGHFGGRTGCHCDARDTSQWKPNIVAYKAVLEDEKGNFLVQKSFPTRGEALNWGTNYEFPDEEEFCGPW